MASFRVILLNIHDILFFYCYYLVFEPIMEFNLEFDCKNFSSLLVIAFCPNNHEVHIYKFFTDKWEKLHVLSKVDKHYFCTP